MYSDPHQRTHRTDRRRRSSRGANGWLWTLSVAAILAASACQEPPADPGALEAPPEPWSLESPVFDPSDGISVLIVHDMEGLVEQRIPSSFDFGTELYPSGQRWLAEDVNAVVAGLAAGGATEILVADGHGSGNPEPDLRGDLLDERATRILRPEPFDTYFDLPDMVDVDAVAVVGMHAKTGSGGFASHTSWMGTDLLINGRSITETELVALSWGRRGVPVVFASGDDRLAADLETMPWIQYVTVKEARGADDAILRPADEARRELREKARVAIEELASARSMRVSKPIVAGVRAVPPASLAMLERIPGMNYGDDAYAFSTDDLRTAYSGMMALVRLSRLGYVGLLEDAVREHEDGDRIWARYRGAVDRVWFDQESGRLEETGPDDAAPAGPRQYHGFR